MDGQGQRGQVQAFPQIAAGLRAAQQAVQRRTSPQAEAHDHERAGGVSGLRGRGQGLQQPVFHGIELFHSVKGDDQTLPLHRPQRQELFLAGEITVTGLGSDQQTAARAAFIDVESLGVAGIGDEGMAGQDAAFMHMAQGPGIQPGGTQIVQRAGGVPVLRGAAFHAAMQHAQLEAIRLRLTVEEVGQVAGLPDAGMADAVDHGQGGPVPVQHMLLGLRAEDGHVVGPVHGLQPRVQRVMVAVGPEGGDAAGLQAQAAVAQGQLGFDAVLFLIVDVPGQDEEVRPQLFAQVEQASQGREGGFAQLRLQGLPGIGTAQAQEGGVQMQVGGVDVSEAVHGVSLAWAPPAEICFFRQQDKLRAWKRVRLTLSKPVGMTSVYTTGGKNGANPLRHPRDRAWPCHARADHRPPSGRTRISVRGQ